MFANFFDQVEKADELGFGIGWVAQAHLSTEVQKRNSKPVVPHYPGEVGLCTDFVQIAQKMFTRSKRMEVGSAVMCLLANGGPIAHAERIGAFSQCMAWILLKSANCTLDFHQAASNSWLDHTE